VVGQISDYAGDLVTGMSEMFDSEAVAQKFATYPPALRERVLALRAGTIRGSTTTVIGRSGCVTSRSTRQRSDIASTWP